MRVQVNPTQLASYGLNMENVRAGLMAASLDAAKGSFDGPRQSYQIDANDQITTSDDYRQLVLAYRNGSPVMLKDVANVVDGIENTQASAWMNRVPAVIVNIQRQPGANIIDVVDRIKALLPKLRATIPPTIKISVLTDRTTTVRASVSDVEFELMLCIALVVGGHLRVPAHVRRARMIPSVAVPLSLIGTFGGDVRPGLQPEQPDPDGPHDLDRVRRRRRDRDDREHLAATSSRGRRRSPRRSRAPSRSGSRSCR